MQSTGAVNLLTQAAQAAAAQAKKKTRPERRARNPGNVALRVFISSLAGIYENIFDRAAGASVSATNGHVGGPTIRFVQAALRPLHIDKTNDSVREYLP